MEPEAVGSGAARCPTCSAAVERDWLTCRNCGAILAAVRRGAPPPDAQAPPTDVQAPAPETAGGPASAPSHAEPAIDTGTDEAPSAVGQPAPAPAAPLVTPPPAQPPSSMPDWPSPPPPPAEPAPPTTQAVHTAAIVPESAPMSTRELGPNEWYSSRSASTAAGPAETTPGAAAATPSAVAPPGGVSPAATPSTTEPPRPGIFADLPLAIPESGGGRVATLGLLLVAVAFFLPWSPLVPGISYFDAWGFSRASRLLIFVADLVLLVLAVQPIGLSARVRTGWLPLTFGIFVVGVFWERVDALSFVGIGAWLFAIGGLMSAIGGLIALVARDGGTTDGAPRDGG